MERMRECPFCADGKLDVVAQEQPREYVVRCQECGAQGPSGVEPEHAAAAWNLRYGRLTLVSSAATPGALSTGLAMPNPENRPRLTRDCPLPRSGPTMEKTPERIAAALRDALTAYSRLEASGQARVVVELFGLRASKHAAPLLDEVARIAQSAQEE